MFSLKNLCSDFLSQNLDLDNCCLLLTLAKKLGSVSLKETCLKFICENFSQVAASGNLLDLDMDVLAEIIRSDEVQVPEETQVFGAALHWLEAALVDRDEDISLFEQNILPLIRFSTMTSVQLDSTIAVIQGSCLQDSQVLHQLIREAVELGHQALPPLRGDGSAKNSEELVQGGGSSSSWPPVASSSAAAPVTHTILPANASAASSVVSVGHRTLFLLLEKAESLRLRSRSTSRGIPLNFLHPGDNNGLFYFLGCNYGISPWKNPHNAKLVRISSSSSPLSRYSRPDCLVDPNFHSTWFSQGQPPYIKVDLTETHTLVCNRYAIRTDSSDSPMSNWNFESSVDGVTWTILREHRKDFSLLVGGGVYASFPVSATEPMRFFRVVLVDSSRDAQLHINQIELYGVLFVAPEREENSAT